MKLVLVNPVLSSSVRIIQPAPRSTTLDGLVIGLIDNGKTHASDLLDGIAEHLKAHYNISTMMVRKDIVSLPPNDEQIDELARRCGAIIAAVGD